MQHTTHSSTTFPNKLCACILAAVLALSLCPLPAAPAYGDEIADKQAEAESVLANLNAMQSTLDRLSAEYGEALAEQQEAEKNRDDAERRLAEINKQIERLQERLGERAREMYRQGSVSFLDTILGAQSFDEFATNLELFNRVNENDAEMVQQRKELREEAEEQKAVFNEQAAIAAEQAALAEAAAADAQATVTEMQATYDSLSAEVAELLEAQRAAEEAAEAARAAQTVADSANGGSNGGSDTPSSPGNTYNPADDQTVPEPSYEGGSDAVSRAYACLGAPYVWGAVGPNGYDCSGLVSYCLSGSHVRLGTTATFINWPQVSNPQPGDVCVIHQANGSQHTGIYIGGGQMIHAATYGVGVIVGPVQAGMIIVRQP